MRSRTVAATIGLALTGAPLGCCLEIVEGEAFHSPVPSSASSATGTAASGGSSTGNASSTAASSSGGFSSGTASGTGPGTTGGSSGTTGGTTGSLSSTGGGASSTGTSTGAPPDTTLWIGGEGALSGKALTKEGDVAFDETCPSPQTMPPALYDGFAEAIDGQGNLWSQGPDLKLYLWTPAQLLQSCASMMPAIGLASAVSGPVAFDSQGNLWSAEGNIEGYSASDMKATQVGGPSWVLAGDCGGLDILCAASGLAFDSKGTLWIANLYSVLAFAPVTLDQTLVDAGAGNELPNTPADLTLTTPGALTWDGGSSGRYYGAYVFNNLAFDANGNLWVSAYDYQADPATHEIVEYTAAQLRSLATDEAPTPILTIRETTAQQQEGFLGWVALAFDADGNLWAGSPPGIGPNLFRFSAASIAKNGGPDITLSVPADASLSLAFSPIPPNLPIQP